MRTFDAQKWAKKIRKHKNPLVVAGEGCELISLDGKPLVAYAADLAEALSCPVAATGNIVLALQEQGRNVKTKKMWLAELFRYLQEDWQEPLLEKRPDLLLLIGYRPGMVRGMVARTQDLSIAHLGPGELASAQLTMEETPLVEWKQRLDDLVSAFK
jgi:CO dehydrogenase/acetyl-CoA synthase epsilon subunit